VTLPIFHVNAFTRRPFAGNPAAVCLLPEGGADPTWMQAVAAQMNLSETAYVSPEGDGWRLRWFTPRVEVDLCGHATLAGAHVLWEEGRLPPDRPARFFTRGGALTCHREGERIRMDFPARPAELCPPPDGLRQALGAPVRAAGRNGMDWLVELEDEAAVRGLRPDLARLAELPVRGVIVTAPSRDFDFVSRFFAPAVGVPEDPVTGSAHCCLGPFWAQRLGKTELCAYQASERGGELRVRVDGARVHLSGEALTVLRGELFV
jgi:predicted PhzF superfamily epimerase YddE/YHI9